MTGACYPHQATGNSVVVRGGGCRTCGNATPLISIGEFISDVCMEDCVRKISKIYGLTTTAAPVPVSVTLGELLRCLFTFNSLEVKFEPNVSVGQACTFYVEPELLGIAAGASHHKKLPIYCNMVQQLPSIGVGISFAQHAPVIGFMLPSTLGQFELQINPFVTPYGILGEPTKLFSTQDVAIALNTIPILAKFAVKAHTPIFEGFI